MSKLLRKTISIGTTLVVAFMLMGPVVPAKAVTAEELQTQIDDLLATLADLQDQLSELTGEEDGVSVSCNFTRYLYPEMSGTDVKCLQEYLNSTSHQVNASGVGSPGYETQYYGPLTKAAVTSWQAAHGVAVGNYAGYFGPASQVKYDALVADGVVDDDEDEELAEGLNVAFAADNPAAAVIPSASLYNPMLKLDFTAEDGAAVITGLTITRGGLIANTAIEGVSMWDEDGNRLGNIISALTADGEATIDFGADDVVISDGETKSITVKVNMASTPTSGTVNFRVASASDISVSGDVTVNGSFPLVGNLMSLADGSASLGDIYLSAVEVGGISSSTALTVGSGNLEVGDTSKIIGKFRFNQSNSLESVVVERVVVYVEGTINEDKDLTNWELYAPDGSLLASADKPDDRYVTFDLGEGYTINKGLSRDLTVRADIADGSTHYFRAQIQNDYDIMAKGVTTGAYVKPLSSLGAVFVYGDAAADNSYFRIKRGDLTISKAVTCPSGTISPGDQNIVLAKFALKSAGEKLEIRRMGIAVATTGAYVLTGTLKVQDADTSATYLSISGATVGLQGAAPTTITDLSHQNLSTYIVIPSGETKNINVIGTVSSNATSNDAYTIYVGAFYAKRHSSNDYQTLPIGSTSVYPANKLDVSAVSLTVVKNAAFGGGARAKSLTEAPIGEFVLKASSADDIRVSTLKIDLNSYIDAVSTLFQNLYITNEAGTQLGGIVGTPASTGDTFTTDFTIPAAQSEIIKVYADIMSGATTTWATSSIPASGISGYGINSSKTVPATLLAISSPVYLSSAALTIKRDAAAPTPEIVLAGDTGVVLNELNFEASADVLTLKEITFELVTASSTEWTTAEIASNFSKVYLYEGDALLNTGGTPLSGTLAEITGLNVLLLPTGPKVLTVKADITGSGTMNATSVAAIKVYSTTTDDLIVYSSIGLMDTGITLTSSAQSNYFLFHDVAPTVEAVTGWSGPRDGNPATREVIAKFVVQNPGTRTLTLTELKLDVTLSGAGSTTDTVTDFELFDVSDTLLATSTINPVLAGATSSLVTFDPVTYEAPAQEIAAGGSKTFVVKANTLSVEAGETTPGQVIVRLSSTVGGSKGYVAENYTAEYEWKESHVKYSYEQFGTGVTVSGNQACDSVPVYGPTLSY